jgi:integrase
MIQPKFYETKRGTYVVTWPESKHGKTARARREYSNKAKALAHFQEIKQQLPIVGASGLSLDAAQMAEFHAARQILPDGVSLTDAARFYIAKNPLQRKLDIDKALEEWLLYASRTDKGSRTGKDRRNRMRKFIEDTGINFASDLTTEVAEKWLWRGVSPQTMIQEASFLRSFCRWLLQRKRAIDDNPIDRVEIPSGDDPDPRTLSAEQVRGLMDAARKRPFGRKAGMMVPFFAIAVFAGLRPSEILRLTADSVKLEAAEPFIRVRKLKRGRGVRLAPVSDTLKAWLTAYPPAYPIAFTDRTFRQVRIDAGLKDDWQPDVMRHTCISVWLGLGHNEDIVAAWAGNSPKVIHRHYRELLTKGESLAIDRISP